MSKKDRATHLSDILSIRKAFEEAEANLHRHKNTLEKIIEPFENEMKILKKIEFQKNKLNQEREEILRQVNKVFDN
jgi:cysteine sulfinate desulfinase/cysteine desulfurase-like protein